jgi:hypothetical protein
MVFSVRKTAVCIDTQQTSSVRKCLSKGSQQGGEQQNILKVGTSPLGYLG